MLNYETLDAIADSYNPTLAVIALVFIGSALFQKRWKIAAMRFAAFAIVVFMAYGLMFLDNRFKVWPALGLDYSTHTAVALGLVILLSFNATKLKALWFGSFAAYVLLMLYQRYHTIADIVTTALAVGAPTALLLAGLYRLHLWKAAPSPARQ